MERNKAIFELYLHFGTQCSKGNEEVLIYFRTLDSLSTVVEIKHRAQQMCFEQENGETFLYFDIRDKGIDFPLCSCKKVLYLDL